MNPGHHEPVGTHVRVPWLHYRPARQGPKVRIRLEKSGRLPIEQARVAYARRAITSAFVRCGSLRIGEGSCFDTPPKCRTRTRERHDVVQTDNPPAGSSGRLRARMHQLTNERSITRRGIWPAQQRLHAGLKGVGMRLLRWVSCAALLVGGMLIQSGCGSGGGDPLRQETDTLTATILLNTDGAAPFMRAVFPQGSVFDSIVESDVSGGKFLSTVVWTSPTGERCIARVDSRGRLTSFQRTGGVSDAGFHVHQFLSHQQVEVSSWTNDGTGPLRRIVGFDEFYGGLSPEALATTSSKMLVLESGGSGCQTILEVFRQHSVWVPRVFAAVGFILGGGPTPAGIAGAIVFGGLSALFLEELGTYAGSTVCPTVATASLECATAPQTASARTRSHLEAPSCTHFDAHGDDFTALTIEPEHPQTTGFGWTGTVVDPLPEPSIEFRVAGGVPPYTWSLDDRCVGAIDASSGRFVPGRNMSIGAITVADATGRRGRTSVTVATTDLHIQPYPSTVSVSGATWWGLSGRSIYQVSAEVGDEISVYITSPPDSVGTGYPSASAWTVWGKESFVVVSEPGYTPPGETATVTLRRVR